MMRSLLTLLFVVAILLGNASVFADDAPGIPDEILKELDYIAGTWRVDGQIGDKKQTGGFTLRWARTDDKQKVCLIGQFSYETDGVPQKGVTLIGWNAAKKCIEDRGFDANGGNGVLYWTVKSPTKWGGEVVMVADGKEVRSEAVLIKKGQSEVVMESESEDGQVSRWVFHKVKHERKKRASE